MSTNFCKQTWFNPNSENDQVLTTYKEKLNPLEVDNLEALQTIHSNEWTPKNEFVVFQQWGPNTKYSSQTYFWFNKETAQKLGEIIKNSPIHKLILIFTTIENGALEIFTKTVSQNQLEFLGLFWALSDDSIIDNAINIIPEIVSAANYLQLSRLSILTPELNEETEQLFTKSLKENNSLKVVKIFKRNDENNKHRPFETPNINLVLRNK